MEFDGNFRYLGKVNINSMIEKLACLTSDDWEQSERNQRFPVHKHTQTIPLLYDDDFRFYNPTKSAHYTLFEPCFAEAGIFDLLKTYYCEPGYALRLLLVKLKRQSEIPRHTDKGPSLRVAHRIHLAIASHPGNQFSVGSERRHLEPGAVWEINNCREHAVVNASHSERIHLIVDWVSKSDIQEIFAHLNQNKLKKAES